jgi:membrane fusion protein (multidrug efflux system)
MTYERPRHKFACLIGVILSACLCAGCSSPISESAPASAASNSITVITTQAVLKPLGTEIEAVGTARANESVDITSEVSRKVTAIRFTEGVFVRRGTLLVELDNDEAKADLAEAEAALFGSEKQFQRSRDLFAQQALSGAQLDQIEAGLKADRARVEAARARLADTVIHASIDGRTGLRRVSVGALVNPSTVITTLDDISLIKLNFTVPETLLFLLRTGLPITAVTPAFPGKRFHGEIAQLDSRVDPVTRSITVRAGIPNEAGLLRPGMFLSVRLQGEVSPALVVPETAIVPEHDSAFVFVVRDTTVERRKVRLGRRRPGEVEITAGLEEQERVVIKGTQNVRDGMTVREAGSDTPGAS